MGCRDRDSDWNHYIYRYGKWWCSFGFGVCFEAPSRDLIEERLEELAETYQFDQNAKTGSWQAWPHDEPA